MTRLAAVTRFLRLDLWTVEPSSLGLLGATAVRTIRFVAALAREFQEHALSLRAMSLVYTTLLSLVPFLAVMFSVLKAFGAHYRVEPLLAQFLEPIGPQGPEITRRIVAFVNNMKVGVLGTVGLTGLFVTAVSLLEKIEAALNHVWRVRHPRTMARRFSDYLSVVLVGPVLVVSAFGLIASAESHWLVQKVVAIAPLGNVLVVVYGRLLPFLFLWAAFSFLYRFMPHTSVRLVSALIGGATAAALWQLAGLGFTLFIASSSRYAAIYSGFAVLILFLIWLYVAWLVVLIGAEVSYFHQYPLAYRAAWRRHGHLFRERIALAALAAVSRAHLSGHPPVRLEALASAVEAPLADLDQVLDGFVRRGIILRSAEPEGVALARPPEQVSILDALHALRDPDATEERALAAGADAVGAVLRLRDRAVRQALDGLTLASLAAGLPAADDSPQSRIGTSSGAGAEPRGRH
jgi:membrane protein